MPGATFMLGVPSGIPSAAAQQQPTTAATRRGDAQIPTAGFLIWVVLLGVVVPAIVLGGLHAGRFRFVFLGR